MKIIKLTKKNERAVIAEAVKALKEGKSVVYPTDTSYGLGVNALSMRAIQRLYDIKGRSYNKPVHVLVPSIAFAKKIVDWNFIANALAKKFLPGPLSMTLPLLDGPKPLHKISQAHFLGIRFPNHSFALKLAKAFGGPITATSANPAKVVGGVDPYSLKDVVRQFEKRSRKPDLVIDAGRLPKRLPSTFVQIIDEQAAVLREGPIKTDAIIRAVEAANKKGRASGRSKKKKV